MPCSFDSLADCLSATFLRRPRTSGFKSSGVLRRALAVLFCRELWLTQCSQKCIADLGHVLIDVCNRPIGGLNGRQYIDMHGTASKNFVSLWRDVARVVNDYRYNRDTGLNRHMKTALF